MLGGHYTFRMPANFINIFSFQSRVVNAEPITLVHVDLITSMNLSIELANVSSLLLLLLGKKILVKVLKQAVKVIVNILSYY